MKVPALSWASWHLTSDSHAPPARSTSGERIWWLALALRRSGARAFTAALRALLRWAERGEAHAVAGDRRWVEDGGVGCTARTLEVKDK